MNLRPYQIEGRDFLASRRHALLADEMRVGKTPQAILAAHKAGASSVTVVCPAIAVPHWQREFPRWWPGGYLPRLAVYSYNTATRLLAQTAFGLGADVFIPDECHFAKNPEAQRTQMVYGKGGIAWQSGATWPLSGTPAPKHAGELWPMLRAFGVVGMTYFQFVGHYCTFDWTGTKITGTKEKYIPELRQLLAQVMLRRTRKQVAPDMPGIDFQFLAVDPVSRADLTAPNASDSEMLEWLEVNRSAQKDDRIAVAKAKALTLVENIQFAIENDLLKQTVVFGWHREPLEAVTQALLQRGIRAVTLNGDTPLRAREAIQEGFRRGDIQVVDANILAAGTAIDLSAARHGYFLELDWVPGNNMQAANRLVSMEKMDKVTMDVVTWPGSADDRVQRILLRRAQETAMLMG